MLGNVEALSVESDVWSYGIVLYEIFTIGGIPYPGWSEGKVIAEVVNGYRMPKPPHVVATLYDQMANCWNQAPSDRPPFVSLQQAMDSYIREETYLQVLDMDKYKPEKYSNVEDIGAEQTKELGNEQGAAAACAAADQAQEELENEQGAAAACAAADQAQEELAMENEHGAAAACAAASACAGAATG
ncbi:hypothetical protein ACROYT_G033242 [Oculina patagonica]